MMDIRHEWVRLEAGETVVVSEVARVCGFSEADLRELAEYGSLQVGASGEIGAERVPALREAARLRRDLDLDLLATSLVIGYLERIQSLEDRLRALQARVPARMQHDKT